MKRIISGVIAIPLVLGVVLYGSPLLFFGFVAAVVLVASYEYFSMISNMGVEGFPFEGGVLELGTSSSLLLSSCLRGRFAAGFLAPGFFVRFVRARHALRGHPGLTGVYLFSTVRRS